MLCFVSSPGMQKVGVQNFFRSLRSQKPPPSKLYQGETVKVKFV